MGHDDISKEILVDQYQMNQPSSTDVIFYLLENNWLKLYLYNNSIYIYQKSNITDSQKDVIIGLAHKNNIDFIEIEGLGRRKFHIKDFEKSD